MVILFVFQSNHNNKEFFFLLRKRKEMPLVVLVAMFMLCLLGLLVWFLVAYPPVVIMTDNKVSSLLVERTHYLCVLTVFKNEGHILGEWIQHYLDEGVDHLFMVNHFSEDVDDMDQHLQKYRPFITILPGENTRQQPMLQKVYEKHIQHQYRWCFIGDLDEFLYAPRMATVRDVLKHVDRHHTLVRCLGVPWKMFGSNGHRRQPVSVVHHFLKRDHDVHKNQPKYPSNCIKCVFRTDTYTVCGIHLPQEPRKYLSPPHGVFISELDLDVSKQQPLHHFFNMSKQPDHLNTSLLHINHYAVQSLEFFDKIKQRRKTFLHSNARNDQYFLDHDTNVVLDDALSQKKLHRHRPDLVLVLSHPQQNVSFLAKQWNTLFGPLFRHVVVYKKKGTAMPSSLPLSVRVRDLVSKSDLKTIAGAHYPFDHVTMFAVASFFQRPAHKKLFFETLEKVSLTGNSTVVLDPSRLMNMFAVSPAHSRFPFPRECYYDSEPHALPPHYPVRSEDMEAHGMTVVDLLQTTQDAKNDLGSLMYVLSGLSRYGTSVGKNRMVVREPKIGNHLFSDRFDLDHFQTSMSGTLYMVPFGQSFSKNIKTRPLSFQEMIRFEEEQYLSHAKEHAMISLDKNNRLLSILHALKPSVQALKRINHMQQRLGSDYDAWDISGSNMDGITMEDSFFNQQKPLVLICSPHLHTLETRNGVHVEKVDPDDAGVAWYLCRHAHRFISDASTLFSALVTMQRELQDGRYENFVQDRTSRRLVQRQDKGLFLDHAVMKPVTVYRTMPTRIHTKYFHLSS